MRSPKITVISQEEYHVKYWPGISHAVSQILCDSDNLHFSQEELLRAIYNVCCQRHSAMLYSDLMKCISNHLHQVAQHLALLSDAELLPNVIIHLQRYKKSIAVLQQLFRYLERCYIFQTLGTPLNILFMTTFNQGVIHDPQLKPRLINLLHIVTLSNTDQNLCMALAKELYSLDKDNAGLCMRLFSMYIPSVQVAHTIDNDIKETQLLIQQLTEQGWYSNTSSLANPNSHKRKSLG